MGAYETEERLTWQHLSSTIATAHELKSPLVLIRQLALQLEYGQHDPVAVERIRLTAERTLRLVDDLTKTARLEDGFFESEPLTIGAIYHDVAHEIEPLARALSMSVEVRIPRNPLTIVANPTLIKSVLVGLCDNALSHNLPAKPIVLSASKSGGNIMTNVRDFGPDTEALSKLRQKVGQSVMPMNGRPRSSGLGLLIARHFADHMHAELLLTRHRSGGASFTVKIPESSQLSLLGASS